MHGSRNEITMSVKFTSNPRLIFHNGEWISIPEAVYKKVLKANTEKLLEYITGVNDKYRQAAEFILKGRKHNDRAQY